MCEPIFFDVTYEINPWMNPGVIINRKKAHQQWFALVQLIESCGAEVVYIDQQPKCPDMVFTANYGLVFERSIYLSFFKEPERRVERQYVKRWFEDRGYSLLGDALIRDAKIDDPLAYQGLYFEGQGDVALTNTKLFAAYGFRTDIHVHCAIQSCFSDLDYVPLKLINPNFFHLDMCFCPLNDLLALRYPGAFDDLSNYALERHINCIDVSATEAQHFACNCVVINNCVIMPSGCELIAEQLMLKGFDVKVCDFSEFIKSGGAAKSLILRIA